MDQRELQQDKDHDLIIRLSADVRSGFESITASIKRLEDGTYQKITDHESRIKHIEDRALSIRLDTLRDDVETRGTEWLTFKDRFKVYMTIAVFGGAILVFVLQQFISGYISVFFR